MEITGKLIMKLDLQSGMSQAGKQWQKQQFVIETVEQYPKKVCSQMWGDKVDTLANFNIGDMVTVSFDIESREFNGRWYTDVKAWKIEAAQVAPINAGPTPAVSVPTDQPFATIPQSTMPSNNGGDLDTFSSDDNSDLPF
ncbi:MAG: DUF3127 domain-containing protein [Bacteroidales bacterium]|nr:DUF3127 domain-containing protein [Bacteroidales bacterium]